jgi:hypothetical protein
MIPQSIPSVCAAAVADLRACEREMAETERHLARAIGDSRATRTTDSALFAFFIASAAAAVTVAAVRKISCP